jgi:predicted helicase
VATIHSLLAEIRQTSLSQHEKGDRFERLMQAYLRADPMFVERFEDVWLWSQWPDNRGKAELDVLLARTASGLRDRHTRHPDPRCASEGYGSRDRPGDRG